MATVDRPAGEAVEQQRAADAPPPPPPPDTPGAEGFPSRAESKAFAAAAADSQRRDDADDRPDTSSAPDAAGDEQDTSRTDGAEAEEAPDRDGPETREDGAADRSFDGDHGAQDDGPEPPSSPEERTEAGTVSDDQASADTTVQIDAADHRAPDGVETDTGEWPAPIDSPAETADDQRPDNLGPPSDPPGADSEALSSAGESSTDADAADIDQGPDVEQDAEPLGGREDVPDQQGGDGPPADAIDDRDPVDPSDSVGQPTGVDATTSDTDADLVDGSDEPDEDAPADGAGPAGEPRTEAPDTAEEERIPTFDFTTNDGKHVLAYLDRDDESDELEKPGSPPDPPSGEELLEMESDELSQPEQFRRMFYKNVEDTHDVVTKGAKASQDMLGPKPTGQAEIQIPEGGAGIFDAQHATVDAGSAAGAALVVGVVGAELIRWSAQKVPKWIGDHRAGS